MLFSPRAVSLLLALALLGPALAGCIGAADDEFASFDQAQASVHTTVEPEEASTVRLGLIEPTATEGLTQSKTTVTVLLWDEIEDEPITDASVTVDAFMPMMGHGTEPETDPTHVGNGVYRGETNLMMGGSWLVHLNATLADGDTVSFPLDLDVTGAGHGMDHGDEDPTTTYGSYEEARQADAETFAPEENSPLRLALIEPGDREDLTTGELNVTALVHDPQAEEPVKEARAHLNATMPAMGHGTSPETDPQHAGHGVWKANTTPTMNGTWVLNLDVKPTNASWLHWDVNVTVGSRSMDMGEMDEGPAFEPYTRNFTDNVTSENYTATFDLAVEGADATVQLNGTLADAAPEVDNLTVTLGSPNGTELGSFELERSTAEAVDGENATGELVLDEAPARGTYEIAVAGSAVDTSYHLQAHVTPP
jgi:hypothetical protein